MKFLLFAAAFAALTLAAPAPLGKRAVFTTKTYDELSISGGVAGNAKQEALDVLSGLPDDLSTVEKADLDFLNSVNQIANKAETEVFNPAIEAATDGDEADALQVPGQGQEQGLEAHSHGLKLQAQAAQGQDVASKLAKEQTKLDKNIALDEDAAELPSTALSFDATTS
ncbi:hypothetical protein CONLIGDRAFT_640059 [Coniochaeta ligniaria NRRL 30616]|uniref:Small secreted protein n=1 Tax=Coniochaeta ligniaria NRRL 30616 TaxID=1408157 RepID=A0A1J7JYI7_9PEZI|nr:hypothetical protein CONLIGDRAFT_640059 [Coniochaeta ligniaria NRRL 30616]